MGGKKVGIFGLIFSFISVLLGLLLPAWRRECNSILFCLKPFGFSTHLLSPYSVHLLHNENSLCSLYGIIIIFASCSFSLFIYIEFNLWGVLVGGVFPVGFFLSPHPVSDFSEVILQFFALNSSFHIFQYHNQSRICFCAVCLLLILII